MTNEQKKEYEKDARKMVDELLAEVDKTAPKIVSVEEPMSPKAYNKYIRDCKKKGLTIIGSAINGNEYKNKPAILIFLASLFSKIFPFVMTIYTLLIIPILFYAWQLYKLSTTNGWQSIFHTPKTLYILGYILVFFILMKLQVLIYKYANEE